MSMTDAPVAVRESIKGDPSYMMEVNPVIWAYFSKLRLVDGDFTMTGRTYQKEPLQTEAQRITARKATQGGWTLVFILRSLHRMIYKVYSKGILYLFPTTDDVIDFSSSRFKPLINDNAQAIGQYVRDTNRDALKRIGDGFLFFRSPSLHEQIKGYQKTSHKLKGIPADCVIWDEFDNMDPESEALGRARMSDSIHQHEIYLGNPTIPDVGIDRKYESESDRRIWLIKCKSCGKESCLELEFPASLKRNKDGAAYLACVKCGKEVFVKHGRWEPRNPERTDYMQGYWNSQLIQPNTDLTAFLDAYENIQYAQNISRATTEFYNLNMGMAYIAAENRLTLNDVYRICGRDAQLNTHIGPCAAGIDVGSMLHVVIGYRPADYGLRICKVARVSSFNDVEDLCKRFGVTTAVFDREPEIHKVREFQKNVRFEVFGCDYQENQRRNPAFDSKEYLVTINRTEMCDASHDLVTKAGRLELPRIDDEMEVYAEEMTNIAKVLQEDDQTGSRKYVYRKLGPDHYRHATNYFMLAAMRIGVYEPDFEASRPKDIWSEDFATSDNEGSFMGA